ncbi:MAG: diaminopimelate epimerase [Spirochaetae bacterium HGW-Spirochaetae-7]|jgi:diaminopimelate epimerase|nr:MAG: diaminopimelate epimerase [Spirochaetae bacterium HGW-Spirochaetae-7]
MGVPDFRKYHGLGNDYIVIDPSVVGFEPTAEAVRAVCDRNYGAGSDGILFGPLGAGSAVDLRIFNPDGSEAEKSGNGIRIFAWYLFERGLLPPAGRRIETIGGPTFARVVDAALRMITVDMGEPSFLAVDRELAVGPRTLRATLVSIGNPHCVVLMPGADAAAARELGPLIEIDPLFPRRINVQFLEPLSRSRIRIEIWERGAGYTLASGSSSCAAAAAARRLGLVDDSVTVEMPGGELVVEFRDGHAWLTGPVEPVFEGRFSAPLRERLGL